MERETMSARYTVCEDPSINQIIATHVLQISKRVLAEVNDVIALFLLGGYARGEGSVLRNSNQVIPLGDYDFLIVSRLPHHPPSLPWIEELQHRFRVQYHIGVDSISKYFLPVVGKRIYWYETKFGSRLLFGDTRILNSIPIHGGADIDLDECLSLMSNRLEGLIRSFDFSYLKNPPTSEQAQHLVFQSVKAILACGESLLLMRGRYDYSYEERRRRFSKWFKRDHPDFSSKDPKIEEDFEKATLFKLRPDFNAYSDPVELWFTAKKHILETLRYYASIKSDNHGPQGRDVEFPELLLSQSHPNLVDYVRFNYNSIRLSKSLKGLSWIRTSFSDIVRFSLIHLALSVDEDGQIEVEGLERALDSLSRIYPVGTRSLNGMDPEERWLWIRAVTLAAYKIARP